MSEIDTAQSAPAAAGNSGGIWLVLVCCAVALVIAPLPGAGVLSQQGPTWLALAAGAAVFPFLPLLWHGLAEVGHGQRPTRFSSRTRFALRSLALALLVLGVSLSDLGPRRVVQSYRTLAGRLYARPQTPATPTAAPAPAKPAEPVVPSQPIARHGLESFIPADATLALGLAGSAAMEQLLAAHGVDTREKLAAFSTCKIDLEAARLLIAGRGSGANMIVVRAPGIADERNLYCLVGVMGSDRMQIRPAGSGASKSFLVNGFVSRPLTFELVDESTVVSVDEAWRATADNKVFPAGASTAQGRLAAALERIDRSATLWLASVVETARGPWDMVFDARLESGAFKVQGSSVPPSGPGDRAEISVRAPLAFASALPEGALAGGLRGVTAAVVATGTSLSVPAAALPAPTLAPAAHDAGAAPAAAATP